MKLSTPSSASDEAIIVLPPEPEPESYVFRKHSLTPNYGTMLDVTITSRDENSMDVDSNEADPLLGPTEAPRSAATRILGLFLVLACSIFASTQGAVIKYIHDKVPEGGDTIPAGEIVIILGIHGVCFYAVIVTHQNLSLINFPNRKYIFMRTAMGGIGFVAKVWSIENMPIGDATALLFTIPFFAGIFARFFLKEKYSLADVFATIVGLTGIVLVAQPSFIFHSVHASYPRWYAMVPLGAAIMMGWGYVCVRKAGPGVSPIVVSFYLVAFQVVAGVIYQFAFKQKFLSPSCYEERGLLIVCVVLSVSMYVCLNKGLALEKSATATLVRNVDTALAYFIQIVIFKQAADTLALGGVGLIIAGTVSITLAKAFDITCGVEI